MKSKNFLPKFYYNSVFVIPYSEFYKKGIRSLFFDLDNTLLSPSENKLTLQTVKLLKKLNKKFQVVILSNASKRKLEKIIKYDFFYVYLNIYQKKPSLFGFKKALNLVNSSSDKVVMIGDQLRTDIYGANKMKIISILVKPLNRKKEFLFTKISRFFIENVFINKVKKEDSLLYEKKFKNFIET
ncbi:HAD-IIIA family hydrolase [Texas Phoenix palm phytoplasma]|uniref:HAD-IIIA family hydrolase n=1 Tax=Texas Phoenix palm phytoplasma TaxID=176709 RepID=A0ABS5BJ20_9MOLU|nr:HAD-IIIA family hydrolase [Texas Phoenix palm phytoplasma]MBP3059179.1 HAD-IIIA family hydrolase [Texas Phoenix palm phytoplasma]